MAKNFEIHGGAGIVTSEGAAAGVRTARVAFVILAAAFLASITIQVFLAGLAVFASPVHWTRHVSFVHLFQALPLLMLPLSFAGKLPTSIRWQTGLLFGWIYLMYFTANFRSLAPWVAAAHPVLAMGLFWMALVVLAKTWKVTFERRLK